MSAPTLTPAEHYWVLVHAATPPHVNLAEPRFSAGAVLLTLRDLQATRCLAPNSDGRLAPLGGVSNHTHAGKLLLSTFDKKLSEREWVESLCLSPTTRRLRPLLNELTATVARQLRAPVIRPFSLLSMLGRIDAVDRSSNVFMRAVSTSLAWITSGEKGCAEPFACLSLPKRSVRSPATSKGPACKRKSQGKGKRNRGNHAMAWLLPLRTPST